MWSYIRRSYQSTTKIGLFHIRYNKIRPFETYSIFAKQDECVSASTLSYFSLGRCHTKSIIGTVFVVCNTFDEE